MPDAAHASDLTDEQRREIARLADREAPHKIAARLGLPSGAVKAEVRRLRRTPAPGATSTRRRAALMGTALLGAALVGVAAAVLVELRDGAGATSDVTSASSIGAPAPLSPHAASGESPRARAVYDRLDRAEAVPRDEVLALLRDEEETVRLAGIRAYLAHAPVDRDAAPLLPALDDKSERVRRAALQALGTLSDPGSVRALSAVLAASTRGLAERTLSIDALARIPAVEAALALADAIERGEPALRRPAFHALVQLLGESAGLTDADVERDPAGSARALRERMTAIVAKRRAAGPPGPARGSPREAEPSEQPSAEPSGPGTDVPR